MTSLALKLPTPTTERLLQTYNLSGQPLAIPGQPQPFNRLALSAAHVVADPMSPAQPGQTAAIDWQATIAYRRYLLGQGLGIAEAMDTAQRGMGLDWPTALELIKRTLAETRDIPEALIFSGCGTDQLEAAQAGSLDDVLRAYDEQLSAIQRLDGRIILMASRALARVARGAEDYRRVYGEVLGNAQEPVILHWLGDMFDPSLKGYWGSDDFEASLQTCLEIIHQHADKVDGIKISLLDKDKEIRLRRLLPAGVKMYTGDDFNYPELIAGDEQGYSHALLGIFDAIAPAASHALAALAVGDDARFHQLLAPTLPLARLIFSSPTQYYKTGVVFLAYLNGHQDHFVMLAGHQALRPLPYFSEIFRLADQAGLLADPERAVARMKAFLALYGVAG
ncbi:dihydrodipicolinate synthase family protein [Phytopseudomonas daroniae]|uniref:dihydrodipicolinate synthase family protein n=1 Tax=Phytopseudomonas daroniae TaxID=2487519 RepID=UPI0010385655|nr:dihydrodipicolinate synthase family protein [Pseudomonas daroniae]TBU74521.1 dihydrodipicolinate synthase family protein [Pseudomonas daroniae]